MIFENCFYLPFIILRLAVMQEKFKEEFEEEMERLQQEELGDKPAKKKNLPS
jgi:hypothetical protein